MEIGLFFGKIINFIALIWLTGFVLKWLIDQYKQEEIYFSGVFTLFLLYAGFVGIAFYSIFA